MKDFSPPSCKQHTLHQLTKKGNKELYTNYRPTSLRSCIRKTRKKCVSSCVRLLKRKPDNSTVTVRIHSWNAVLETTKHKWDESFVRGSEVLSTFLKQPSQTVSVKPTQWQGADGENRRRRRTLKREGHRTAFTSICDSTDKEIIQDQRIMKLAD